MPKLLESRQNGPKPYLYKHAYHTHKRYGVIADIVALDSLLFELYRLLEEEENGELRKQYPFELL